MVSRIIDQGFLQAVAEGDVDGYQAIHKFGRNDAVSTSFVPIAEGGIYRTPQVGSEQFIRVKAGNGNDTALGSGAREITVQGIDAEGSLIEDTLATAGASASGNTTTKYLRVFRAWVSKSGTYATATTGSHAADVVLENSGGTEDWATISSTGFARSQTEIGAYTIPLGHELHMVSVEIDVNSTKSASLVLFQRQDILQTAVPYSAMRIILSFDGVAGQARGDFTAPLGPFPALTDIGFLGLGPAGGAEVSADFNFLLVRT